MAVVDNTDWKAEMQRDYCDPVCHAFFGPDADISPVDDDRPSAVSGPASADRIIDSPDGQTTIMQRVRPKASVNGQVRQPDFSLRDADDYRDEIGPLLDAWRSRSALPDYIAFGVGAATTKQRCLSQGLDTMLIVDLPALIRAIATDRLSAAHVHDIEPGVQARFFQINQLRSNGLIDCDVQQPDIQTAWKVGPAACEFPTPTDQSTQRDASLSDF
jgi:hypothetical protein